MFSRLKFLWRNLLHRREAEADLAAEIRSYRDLLEDENTAAGMDLPAARRAALIELGGAAQIQEEVRDVQLGVMFGQIAAEIRQSLRGLRRNPGLTILGASMLALGMGASTAVFSIFQSALLQPLPFRDPHRLVQISETRLARGLTQTSMSEANFWDLRAQNHSFQEVAASHDDQVTLAGMGPAEKLDIEAVTAAYFRTLGVSPVIGRDFANGEDQGSDPNWWNGATVAILGNRFWKTRFSGDPAVLGKTLRLNDKPYTIVGVMPPGEPLLDQPVYIPFGNRPGTERGSWEFFVTGRLKPGIAMEAARDDLAHIAATLGHDYPGADQGIGFRIDPSSEWIAGDATRRALWVLLGAVTFLMLIASLNVANLLLARGTARRREIAVRTALGAGRARLVRFVMMESLILSGLGAVLGVGIAYAAVETMKAMNVTGVPRLSGAGLNPWVLGFTTALALATGLLSGIAPALQAPTGRVAGALREGDRQTGGGTGARLRTLLMTGEVALSFLLLVGAGLLIRSFSHLMTADRGFQTEHRLLFSVSMPGSYAGNGTGKQLIDRILDRLRALPQVAAAGSVGVRPMAPSDPGMSIDSNGRGNGSGANAPPWAGWRIVTPGYFRAAGLPLLRGREFDATDKPVWAVRGQPEPQRHVVLSTRLAGILFPNADPIGQHVTLWKGQSNRDADVVGVVGDSLERGLAELPALTVYIPYGANALTSEFLVETRGNPLSLAGSVRSLIAELDPNVPIADLSTFEQVATQSVAPQKWNAVLLGVFSGLALLLATAGIYGVLSYSTSRRTPEIGLRVALGASGADILRMTVAQGLRPALAGIALGALGAWWLTRYLTNLLFEVKPFDFSTYLAVAGMLLATAIAASYVPGRRAMRIDPAIALRLE
jgi:predicted permease